MVRKALSVVVSTSVRPPSGSAASATHSATLRLWDGSAGDGNWRGTYKAACRA